MPTKQSPTQLQTIRCENCGEQYSITYKQCPFCSDKPQRGGGRAEHVQKHSLKRLLLILLSVALICAACYILVSKVRPILQERFPDQNGIMGVLIGSPKEGQTKDDPNHPDDPNSSGAFSIPDSALVLGKVGDKYQIKTEGTDKATTWTSSDPKTVKVTEDGEIIAIAKGKATVTATTKAGDKAKCDIQVGSTLSLNREDFTLQSVGQSVQMSVEGSSADVTWTIADEKVATVSKTGEVSAVGLGITELTAKVDDQILTCIVRCKF
ncbi:MAG: Ig-like domain-containing protein [Evtepia sp.]